MRNILFTSILLSMSYLIFANPVDMTPLKVIQPNGDSITIIQKGDEYGTWYETLDGYVVDKNTSNHWVYVNTNANSKLVLTNQIVSNVSLPIGINLTNVFNTITSNRTNTYNAFNNDSIFNPDLEDIETFQVINQGYTYDIEQARVPAKNKGEINILTILIQFQDVKFQSPSTVKNFFSNLMNQSNFTHPSNSNILTGCVREYWEDVSYGQLSINPIVIGPYTAEYSIDYYSAHLEEDHSLKTSKTRKLVKEVIKKVAKEGDMRYFDNDNNGFVDFIHIVFAGSNNDIWPHQSNIPAILRDGVWISKYIITPEKEYDRYASIGTICHEMGHAFGAPDFYDRNYELDGLFYGTGKWDLMALGNDNKNNKGHRPAHPNPYIKTEIYGWATAKELEGNDSLYTLRPSELDSNGIYKLSTSSPGEYYLLENRQDTTSLNGTGLLIYHVNSNNIRSVSDSKINTTHPQNLYIVVANTFKEKPIGEGTYGTISSPSATFKNSESNRIYFTSQTKPSNCAWNGTPTQNKDVCFISEEMVNGEMCIKFVLNPAIEGPDVLCDSAIYSLKHVPSNATIEWTYVGAGNVSISGTPFYITSGQGTKNARYKRGSVLKNVIDIPGPVNPFPWAPLNQTAEPLALKYVPYEGTGTIKVNITFRGETYTLTKDVYMPGTVEIDDLGLGLSNPWIAGTRKVFTLASPTDISNYSDVKWDVNIVGGNSFSSYGASVAITPSSNVTTVSITATYTQGCDGNNSHTITIPVTTRPSLSFANPASGSVEISVVEGNNAETQQTMSISQSAPYTGAYRLELWHDVYGKVRELDIPENTPTITMNLDGLNSGVYVLRLIIDNQIVETSQLIIK